MFGVIVTRTVSAIDLVPQIKSDYRVKKNPTQRQPRVEEIMTLQPSRWHGVLNQKKCLKCSRLVSILGLMNQGMWIRILGKSSRLQHDLSNDTQIRSLDLNKQQDWRPSPT